MSKFYIFVTSCAYAQAHDETLREVLATESDLCCSVGVDCDAWEEVMDWLVIDANLDGRIPEAFCITTSHADEPLSEVVEFVDQWCALKNLPRGYRIIEI